MNDDKPNTTHGFPVMVFLFEKKDFANMKCLLLEPSGKTLLLVKVETSTSAGTSNMIMLAWEDTCNAEDETYLSSAGGVMVYPSGTIIATRSK